MDQRAAQCAACQSTFNIDPQVARADYRTVPIEALTPPRSITAQRPILSAHRGGYRDAAPQPAGAFTLKLRIRPPAAALELAGSFFVVLSALFWPLLLGGAAVSQFLWAFPLVHVVIAIYLLKRTLATWRDEVEFKIINHVLEVVPPRTTTPTTSVATSEIRQIYCAEVRDESAGNYYEVYALLNNGASRLASGIRTWEEALYIERAIEQQLALENQPVLGELPGHK